MLATARHLGQLLLTVVSTAWQTLTAGRAFREPMTLVGNPYFVGTTHQPPQHANQAQSQSPESAQSTTLEQKIGNVNQLAQTLTAVQSLGLGLGSATTAHLTPQPASTVSLPKSEHVRQTTAALKHGSESKTAQIPTGNQSTQAGSKLQTPALLTRQPVNQVQSQRNLAVQFTIQEPYTASAVARAQTLMDSLSGENGESKTVAHKILQPAKQRAKPAKKSASKTKAAQKRTPVKAPAQTRTVKQFGRSGK